ncbi:MAG: DUF5362 domain-containing protein [Sedimentisphaerales bacterium]|nr:DUF5362 domain-containing protein [Sedimentisphaerales bacterium]
MNGGTSERVGLVQQISYPIFGCKGWMKLLGVMFIIGGVLYALTLIGIIIAWLPIWQGVLLLQAAGAAENARHTGSEHELIRSLSKIRTYFAIMGVLTLIGLILAVLWIVLMIVFALSGAALYNNY